jgi:protein-disulfide isomerase
MATPGSNSDGRGKKDRREEAREKARLEREAEKKRARRNRILVQSGIGVVVVAIALVVVLVVVNQPKPVALSKDKSGPLNMISDGILLSGSDVQAVSTPRIAANAKPKPTTPSDDKTNIVTYVDYQCPACQAFEATNAEQMKALVAAGKATLEIHPIAILDNSSQGNKYSTRAANAAACVANYEPDKYFDVNTALYANQPAEGTAGAPDSKLISVLKGAGASSDKISKCITTQRFVPWVTAATTRVGSPLPNSSVAALAHTPTVIVNGQEFTGSITDAAAFKDFIESVS